MKKYSKFKRWIRKNKIIILIFIALFLFPLIVGGIYAIPLPRIIDVEAGELLAYYGATFGIIGSFVAYRMEVRKKEKERIQELKPVFSVEVKPIDGNDGMFNIEIINHSTQLLTYLSFYDEFVSSIVQKNYSFKATYNKTIKEKNLLNPTFNITMDPDITDSDGYPKYVQLICNDKEGNAWNCCYYRVKDCDKSYYYPRDFEMI